MEGKVENLPPCAACKKGKNTCLEGRCILRDHFPQSKELEYEKLYNYYGGSSKIKERLANYDGELREKVVISLLWGVDQWASDPIRGPYGAYQDLLDRYNAVVPGQTLRSNSSSQFPGPYGVYLDLLNRYNAVVAGQNSSEIPNPANSSIDQSSAPRSSKRMTGERNEEKKTLSRSPLGTSEDRLSNLPKELLCHILSFVGYGRKTSALSRQWRSLWNTIPDFWFYYHYIDHQDSSCFACFERFINQILDSRKPPGGQGIRKFHLFFEDHRSKVFQPHHFSKWLRGAIECGAQEIDVSVSVMENDLEEPLSVFNSETLTSLKLSGNVTFAPSAAPWLPSLKFLYLNIDYFDEDLGPSLLSGCPSLEEFDINGSYRVMQIFAPNLKKLSTTIQWDCNQARFVIDAPSLEYISLCDKDPMEYVVKKFDNLIKAKIFMLVKQKNLGCLFDLLMGLSNVKSLHFSLFVRKEDTTEKISNYHDRLPEFPNLVRLCFGEFSDLDLLPNFLQKSPNLEVLVIERHDLVDVIWTEPQEVPSCLSSCLAHFTYKGFLGMKEEFEIVEYIVRNSSLLKTLTIQPALSLKKLLKEERLQIDDELARLSKISKSCEFRFEQKPFHSDEEQYDYNVMSAMNIVNRSYIPSSTMKQ